MKGRFLLILSLMMYLVSWFLPALELHSSPGQPLAAWFCFLLGLLFGWYSGHVEAWSNFFYIAALIFAFRQRWKGAFINSAIALLLSVETVLWFWQDLPSYMRYEKLAGLHIGFYCWVMAYTLLFGVAVFNRKKSKID